MAKGDIYRPCVGVMLVNPSAHVFVGKRIDHRSDNWQMPQGGIDEGEMIDEAAYRELQEETGIPRDKVKFVAESAEWLYYDLPDELVPQFWNGKYRGQKQRWILLEFLGTDDDVNINTEDPEFKEWEWATVESLPVRIVSFKKDLYQRVVSEFYPLIKALCDL